MSISPRPLARPSPSPASTPPRPPAGPLTFLLLRALVIVLFAVLMGQLIRLQVVEGERFRRLAEINALRQEAVAPARGLIYDRYGRPLVYNEPYYQAAVVPGDLPKGREGEVLEGLAQLIGISRQEIEARLKETAGRQNPYLPVVVADGLSREVALKLKEREGELPGARLLVTAIRRYPLGHDAAHLLGYVGPITAEELNEIGDKGYTLHDWLGKTGTEMSYEDTLRGTPGRRLTEVDALGHPRRLVAEDPPHHGMNLVLTIDARLQREVAAALRKATSGVAAAVVMDVHTGDILALASLPSFDPNSLSHPQLLGQASELLTHPDKPLLNHALGEAYAPGSVFKPIVAAAALQEGVATPATMFVSHGYIAVAHAYDPRALQVLRDWDLLGPMDLGKALALASHVYFYRLAGGEDGAGGLGPEKLARYARGFGLGSPTGIELPGEAEGLVPDPVWKERVLKDRWSAVDTLRMGAGGGYLQVTPLQMAVATAAIANGGHLLKPRLVLEVIDHQGKVVRHIPRQVRGEVPVGQDALAVVRQAMATAVSQGVAHQAQVPGLSVAGLATVQGPGEVAHGWFVGFAPADDPRVAVVVFLRDGTGPQAAQVASRIFQAWWEGHP